VFPFWRAHALRSESEDGPLPCAAHRWKKRAGGEEAFQKKKDANGQDASWWILGMILLTLTFFLLEKHSLSLSLSKDKYHVQQHRRIRTN
jgi:hypothetical protein